MLRDLFSWFMIAAHALLNFEVEEIVNELTGEIRMKIRTGVIIVLLLAAITVVGFGALGTSTAAGCGGGSSSSCSHETSAQATNQKPVTLRDESLLIADSLEILKQHFIKLINLEDRDQYQAEITTHLNMLRDLQQLVDRFATRSEHVISNEQFGGSSAASPREHSSHGR